jgi:RimJ/RimL family protein N-acetyltransferase
VREAFSAPDAAAVIAHTRAEPGASVRVLQKLGFVLDEEVLDGQVGTAWRFRLARAAVS